MKHLLLLVPVLLMNSCISSPDKMPALRENYIGSLHEFRLGNYQQALKHFPIQESGSFITELEKAWLSLLSGNSFDSSRLSQILSRLEERQTVSISKELSTLVVNEASGNYYPSEHEAVVAHLVMASLQLRENHRRRGMVELRRAARYLQGSYGVGRKNFDDPALRLWLASLWLACNEWQKALVDLRVAAKLVPQNSQLRELSLTRQPPRWMAIYFSGSGPKIVWQPLEGDAPNPIAKLHFQPSIAAPNHFTSAEEPFIHLPTSSWYQRHQYKNQLAYDAIDNSRYSANALRVVGLSSLNLLASTAIAATTTGLGIGAGLGIILAANDADVAGAGIAVAYTGIMAGVNLLKITNAQNKEWIETGLGQVESYRFVRYLPDFVSARVGSKTKREGVAPDKGPFLSLKAQASEVMFYHYSPKIDVSLQTESIPANYHGLYFYDKKVAYREGQKLCAELLPGGEAELIDGYGTYNRLKEHFREDDSAIQMLSIYPDSYTRRLFQWDSRDIWRDSWADLAADLVPLAGRRQKYLICNTGEGDVVEKFDFKLRD